MNKGDLFISCVFNFFHYYCHYIFIVEVFHILSSIYSKVFSFCNYLWVVLKMLPIFVWYFVSSNFTEFVFQFKSPSGGVIRVFYIIISSENTCNLTSLLAVCMPVISFSCLIVLDKTSSTLLNYSGERGHPCLVPDLRGSASKVYPIQYVGYRSVVRNPCYVDVCSFYT